jgi:hypothetical protein
LAAFVSPAFRALFRSGHVIVDDVALCCVVVAGTAPALSLAMLTFPACLSAALGDIPDDVLLALVDDLPDLPRALAVVDLDRVVADADAAVAARLHASRLDE